MRFVEALPISDLNVKLSLKVLGPGEVELVATNGVISVSVLGLRSDGTVVRYIANKTKLEALGFSTDSAGKVALYNL